jgi:hypothetical protein
VSLLSRLRTALRRTPDIANLVVEPAYVIRASARNPYFQSLEQRAREAGWLGSFVVDAEGRLRTGERSGLPTLRGRLSLDVFPNPAAIEGRTVSDYDAPEGPRRRARATVVLDDDRELYIQPWEGTLRAEGAALDDIREQG